MLFGCPEVFTLLSSVPYLQGTATLEGLQLGHTTSSSSSVPAQYAGCVYHALSCVTQMSNQSIETSRVANLGPYSIAFFF